MIKINSIGVVRSAELVNSIAKMSSSAEVIRAMDEISNTVGFFVTFFFLIY